MDEDEEDTEWEVTTPKKKTKRSTTGRNKLNNLSADVAQTGDTNEEHVEESRANDESEAGSAQAVCTPKQRNETVPDGMTSMLAKLRDGMDL